MTDEKKAPDPMDEIDWDQALSEWDNKSFDPEVAKDVVTNKPAALSGTNPSRPLYRPPTFPQAARPRPPAPPAPPSAAKPPRPAPPPPPADPVPTLEPVEEEEGATLIAAIPRELLRDSEPGGAPKSMSRAGLGQLFARDGKRDASVEVSFDESQGKIVAAPGLDDAGEIVTSAKHVAPSRPDPREMEPLRRPSQLDEHERVPEGAMFDPFADPDPRPELSTRPAEEEIASPSPAAPVPEARADGEPAPAPPEPDVAGGSESPVASGPALLAPEARKYDPNEETMIGRDADVARARRLLAARREVSAVTEGPLVRPDAPRTWQDEKPAAEWLSDAAREGLASRASWLEEEARALGDKVARARGLLACSEIAATLGDRERAQALAAEARDLAPSLALAHRQARGLMPFPPDPEDYVEALDAEARLTPSGPARVHSTLLAAEALRAAGEDEAASKRLDQATRMSPADVRAPVERLARALMRGEVQSPALRLSDAPELAPISEAIAAALRLRGVDATGGGEASPNELLLRARQAVDKGDLAAAAPLVAQLASAPEIAAGATWLAASLGAVRPATRGDAARWLRELVGRGDDDARRALAARALELADRELLEQAIGENGTFTSAERATLSLLVGSPMAPVDPHLDATAATEGMLPLAAAMAALATPADGADRAPQLLARAARTAGTPESRASVRLGRLLAAGAPGVEVGEALGALGDAKPPAARAVSLEMGSRSGRAADVSAAIESWGAARGSAEERAAAAIAAAIVAEHEGDRVRALEAFKAARAADPGNEAALRAIASLEQVDLVTELNALADDLGESVRGAVARIEAVTRGEGLLPEATCAELLERAHRAAPALPIASFLAERIARRAGDAEGVIRWVRERRASATDPIEAGLDAVREALLAADRDRALAGERLLEAHRARPGDAALRELYERMAPEPPDDGAAWREQRATQAVGDARTLLFLEAAREHDRTGDEEGALRCADAAAATDASLGRIARERAELKAGRVARLAEELLSVAKGAEDERARREAYERLAVLDATARHDPASALLWHRSILEGLPLYEPSLRHVEHHLIGEGRDDELEPVASAIAQALRGTGPGECTAHAELSARLRMRGAEGSWEATREMAEIAAAEPDPSLWSLRMVQAHARSRGDDEAFLAATLRILERVTRPAEAAALMVRAGEAASRLGRVDEARSLLERAATQDAGDVVAWGLLADVRQRAGDARGAAEACESLARSSVVREHQLLAWYDAGRIWADEAHDDDRAVVALEAAAAIDTSYEDVFDRLSRVYAARKMQPELASLLERRLDAVTDPQERLAMEVQRGRILLEVGDAEGARRAFEAALGERPDDAEALSAFADLCVSQKDWGAAEQALVRLARLLPTPEEQCGVYARLGDLYARHLLNLSRAEVALKEVLKRAPGDVETTEQLIDVYKRQKDPARAVELQQELVKASRSPEEKRKRLVELAAIHEQTAHDNRRAEQTLEAARREFPQDVGPLRALAEFYARHHQTPAFNILLDRAGGDARRALAAGRFSNGLFEVLATVFDLRGRKDAAAATQAVLAALEGRPAQVRGAGDRAFDPRLDDLLATEVLTPAFRALLAKTGEALDAAAPVDVRALKCAPMPADAPLARLAASIAQSTGLGAVQVLVSPKLGATCIPLGCTPPAIALGEALAASDRVGAFLVIRALKLVRAKAAALARTPAVQLAPLVSAWLKCFNPTWQPQGVDAAALNAAAGRIQAALPRQRDPELGILALEVAGALGTQAATLGTAALCWGNRVGLLALGDPGVGLDAIAAAAGAADGAPRDPKERAAWIARTAEARDLVAFGVTDEFAEVRTRLGVDR